MGCFLSVRQEKKRDVLFKLKQRLLATNWPQHVPFFFFLHFLRDSSNESGAKGSVQCGNNSEFLYPVPMKNLATGISLEYDPLVHACCWRAAGDVNEVFRYYSHF